MQSLTEMKCEVCRVDAPQLAEEEIAAFQPQVPEWQVVELDGIRRLERVFKFGSYLEALSFADLVAKSAEAEGHHPAILLEWGKVTVTWWTHKIRGLHRNDFIMAAKTDQLARSSQ